ncbi:MAG: 50S ribosomal protein L30e [Candidatus Diapherotrites archaeon]|nr:50S ribosomal protein L30e [Candidatus Diapherotrites archaeon]
MDMRFQVRRAMDTGRVLLGYRQTEKSLLNGAAKLVIVAKNAPQAERERVEYLAKVGGVPVYHYDGTTVDLGHVCGKPFTVAMLVVEDAGDSSILELAKEE